jgi:hypothetical protein
MEVIIPQMRPQHLDNLIYSFGKTGAPDLITLVSNLNLSLRVASPCPIRQLRYETDTYSTGDYTVVLKRNIGAWWAKHENIVFFDDDQLSSNGMLIAFDKLLNTTDIVYGHHRFIDYDSHALDDILDAPPAAGISREHPVNAAHTFQSGYGGLLGIKQSLYLGLGGMDMWWSNVPSHEDQDFTRRMLMAKGWSTIFVHEPPFAWHPLWGASTRLPVTKEPSNLCNSHHIVTKTLQGIDYEACTLCPWHAASRIEMRNATPMMPFNPLRVNVTESWL